MMRQPMPKDAPFRSDKLRRLAHEAPCCMNAECRKPNEGDIVLAHPNGLDFGKGMGQKADDLPAYACHACHDLIDGRAGILSRDQRRALWNRIAVESMRWLLKNHLLEVA